MDDCGINAAEWGGGLILRLFSCECVCVCVSVTEIETEIEKGD